MAGTVIALNDYKHLHMEARAEFPHPTNFVAGGATIFFDNEAFFFS
jgi:hypothetical protein